MTEVSFEGHPFGILATPANDIWVTDFSNIRLALLDSESGTVTQYLDLDTSKAEPQDLARDLDGNLWVSLQKGSVACVALSAGAVPVPSDGGPLEMLKEPTVLPRDLRLNLRALPASAAQGLPPDPYPIKAIYSPHSSFITPDQGLVLWRYIDLPKLISMLDQRSLFFARLDSQPDRFEGSLPSRTLDDEAASLLPLSVRERPDFRTHFDTMRKSLSHFRSRALMSCWYASGHESTAMWDLYSASNHGIAIRTTAGRLRESIDTAAPSDGRAEGMASEPQGGGMAYYMGAVRYLDYQNDLVLPSTGLDYLTCKRRSYDHEREVRLVILSDIPVIAGQQIACSLDQLVERIYVSPSAPKWFVDAVRAVLKKYDTGWEIRQSDLARDPLL